MPNPRSAEDALLSIPQFAARNGICRTQVYHELNSGRLTARKVGRRVLITPEDERAWRDSLPRLRPVVSA